MAQNPTRSSVLGIAGLALAMIASIAAAPALATTSTPPEPPPPGLSPNINVATQLGAAAVITPAPPTEQQLTQDGLFEFIVHHGSTHYASTAGDVGGSLLRWRGGRAETICPATTGLDQGYDDFVSARVRAVAAFVGAPVQPDLTCKPNVQMIFTSDPRTVMGAVQQWGARALRTRFDHQMEKALQISGEHAIQGWYVTAGGGSSVLNRDPGLVGGIGLQALWPRVIPTSTEAEGANRSILGVVLVINTSKAAGAAIGSIADYLALAALTVIQNPDYCDPLPSILDTQSSACASRDKPTGITAGDLAFLKALYYKNTGLGKTLSRDDIQINMMKQFRGA